MQHEIRNKPDFASLHVTLDEGEAVITESGGPLSHGAVTAREVGLPAVMAVQGALFTLEDGEQVRVDGTSGTVSRLDLG